MSNADSMCLCPLQERNADDMDPPSSTDWLLCTGCFVLFLSCFLFFVGQCFCFVSFLLFSFQTTAQANIIFFFFFNSASRASYRANSLGKRKIFALPFFVPSAYHLRVVLRMRSLNVIPQQRNSMEDILDQTVRFALCAADTKLPLCWDVRAGLMIPALSLHSLQSSRWLQIWHKGPRVTQKGPSLKLMVTSFSAYTSFILPWAHTRTQSIES